MFVFKSSVTYHSVPFTFHSYPNEITHLLSWSSCVTVKVSGCKAVGLRGASRLNIDVQTTLFYYHICSSDKLTDTNLLWIEFIVIIKAIVSLIETHEQHTCKVVLKQQACFIQTCFFFVVIFGFEYFLFFFHVVINNVLKTPKYKMVIRR